MIGRREDVVLDQIVDRDRALMLDIGPGPPDRMLVERDRYEPSARLARRRSSPVEPDGDRARMRVKALRLAKRDRGRRRAPRAAPARI